MTFTSIASSSKGNCYVVGDGETAILLECGLPFRRIKQALGFDLSSIRACLISHEHQDHAKSAEALVKSGAPVFASQGTADALGCGLITAVADREQFSIGSLEILPFAVFHDSAEPLGFLIYSRRDGERLAFATDTVNLAYRFPGVNLLAVEANYDKDILARCRRMPDKVKSRVRNSHMEIGTLCRYLQTLDLSQCRRVSLLHLSAAASDEGDFVRRAQRAVPAHVQVIACPAG